MYPMNILCAPPGMPARAQMAAFRPFDPIEKS